MHFQINPSILSANLACLGDDVRKVLKAGANNIHFDVMDNHYVPNLTFGPMILKSLRKNGIEAGIDVHLMVEPVDEMIERFAEAGASSIVFHPEASKHIDRSLHLIKSFGIDAGLALNPATSINSYRYIVDKLDRLLITTVNPGFGGQVFINEMYVKISEIAKWINKFSKKILLEIDGGVNIDNIGKIAECGANAFVAGSAIFNSQNYSQVIQKMRDNLRTTRQI